MNGSRAHALRILVLAPTGCDSDLIVRELGGEGYVAEACRDAADLACRIDAGAGAAVVAEEALVGQGTPVIASALTRQEPWSDFPILVLAAGGDTDQIAQRSFDLTLRLGNVTVLERPIRRSTLVCGVRAQLRARGKQLEVRDLLERHARTEEELRCSNQDLRQFAYAVTHDLQEPMRMITLYSELLGRRFDGSLDSDGERMLGFLGEGARRMQSLLRDLLAFTQVEAAEPARKRDVRADAAAAFAAAVENCRAAIEESGAVVEAGELPVVGCGQSHLLQLFQNLIGNALKFRSERPPRIRVTAERDGSSWHFRVEDNGIGIDPKFHERVFGLFKRLDPARPGTGMGLAICRRIVERWGGRMWIESAPGAGSTFHFLIAAARESRTVAQPLPAERLAS